MVDMDNAVHRSTSKHLARLLEGVPLYTMLTVCTVGTCHFPFRPVNLGGGQCSFHHSVFGRKVLKFLAQNENAGEQSGTVL